ncbi:MAG: cupin domain-containing protein [Clostridium sp.]|nr:cupin domain-containing protein [Clostridiaceae bacterium]MDD6074864.1 cupin domain-containing protein [Clostridium sp.]MDY5483388.1 cupin domain-containing protein [Clostridium sp.]
MNFNDVDNIGNRIKELRKQKNLTIQKLSEMTDLSIGYLSNLERNQASPTLNNLQKICASLDITVRDLLLPRNEERVLIRKDELKSFEYEEYRLKIERMDFGGKRGVYEFSTYEPGDGIPPSWGLHPYPEVGFILEGSLEVTMEENTYRLEAGDSIYIKAHTYHTMKNAGKIPCRSIWHIGM